MTGSNARTADRLAGALVVLAALASAWLILRVTGKPLIGAAFAASAFAIAALMFMFQRLYPRHAAVERETDWSLVRAAMENEDVAVAITDRGGRLVATNALHDRLFGGPATPPGLPVDAAGINELTAAGRAAWRDGSARAEGVVREGRA
ncbi:MAG: hybrid sensor histidine kinase/response regulator, partial [Sphingomonadaceae bacterium]|nr:hybrid sensor histidine kinase/response regulator [Sphingomonadaceae bacterium]